MAGIIMPMTLVVDKDELTFVAPGVRKIQKSG